MRAPMPLRLDFCAMVFILIQIVAGAGVAAKELRVIVDGVDDDVEIARRC